MQQSRIRPIVEGGILSAVAIVFALISVYLPVIGAFVTIIWPVPIILLGVRHGYRWSILATIVSGILLAVLLHPLHAIGVVLAYGLIGIALGHAFRSGYSAAKSFLLGAAASGISKIAVLLLMAAVLGVNPLADQMATMNASMEQVVELYRNMGMAEEQITQLQEQWQSILQILKLILPAGFALAALLDTYINYVVAKIVLRRMGHAVAEFPAFKEWIMPLFIPYVFAFAAAGIYWGSSHDWPILYQGSLNVEMVASMLLFLQGLSLLAFMADRYNVPRPARWIFLVLILLNGFFTQLLVLAGAMEIVFDYRRLRQSKGV